MMAIIASLFVLAGAFFFAVAGLGVVRLPDVYCRMHAVSKASSLGMGLMLFGVALSFGDSGSILKSALTITFIFLTTPVAAHMLSRAALLSDRENLKLIEQQRTQQPSSPADR